MAFVGLSDARYLKTESIDTATVSISLLVGMLAGVLAGDKGVKPLIVHVSRKALFMVFASACMLLQLDTDLN